MVRIDMVLKEIEKRKLIFKYFKKRNTDWLDGIALLIT